MKIKRCSSRPSPWEPANCFTGTVRIDPLVDPPEPRRVSCASVTLSRGARTPWHTSPLSQTRIVTAGCGSVQT
jgi:quercetin dioxygenase-like cupin family protein